MVVQSIAKIAHVSTAYVLIHFHTWYRAVSSDVPCWAVAGVIWHTDTDTTWRITDNCRKNRKILIVQHMLRIC